MTHLQQIADHLAEMNRTIGKIQMYNAIIDGTIESSTKEIWQYSPEQTSGMIQDARLIIADLERTYQHHMEMSAGIWNAYRKRNVQSTSGVIFSHTSHNSEVAKDMEQL